MFAKLAQSLGFGRRRPAASAPIAAHCNDNHPVRGLAPISQRAPRCALVCGWRRTPTTGRLECFWQVVLVDEAAGVEEPRISWMFGWMERPRGACLAGTPPSRLVAA
jgi:hypothetical protein